jgi:2-methylisocitrate lyase-like PEP mutase family enzyme
MATSPSLADKRRAFRELHTTGCFVIPNPWNVGTALYLQRHGFKALASTSSGLAHASGYADGAMSRDQVLAHFRELAEAVDVPVNADFEDGYAADADGVAESVRHALDTGISGISIEDATGDPAEPLYDFDVALARVRAARAAIDAAGGEVVFTARSEGFIVGRPDLEQTVARLKTYAAAGADCLYAPGITSSEQITAVVQAVAPRPVNFLMSTATNFSVADLAALGVRRISLGGSLARAAWTAFAKVVREIADDGRFDGLRGMMGNAELNTFFNEEAARRG